MVSVGISVGGEVCVGLGLGTGRVEPGAGLVGGTLVRMAAVPGDEVSLEA